MKIVARTTAFDEVEDEPAARSLLRFLVSVALCILVVLAFVLMLAGVAFWTGHELSQMERIPCVRKDLFVCLDGK